MTYVALSAYIFLSIGCDTWTQNKSQKETIVHVEYNDAWRSNKGLMVELHLILRTSFSLEKKKLPYRHCLRSYPHIILLTLVHQKKLWLIEREYLKWKWNTRFLFVCLSKKAMVKLSIYYVTFCDIKSGELVVTQ